MNPETPMQKKMVEDRLERFTEWRQRYESLPQDPRELFSDLSHIAVVMSYDLIDKLRWWEKQTLGLPDDEIAQRIPHSAAFLEKLKEAYLHFAEIDF